MLTGNPDAVDYALRQLLSRAGADPGSWRARISYGPADVAEGSPGIIIKPCAAGAWQALLERPPDSLHWLPSASTVPPGGDLPIADPIPVLFWAQDGEDGRRPFAELREDGFVVFNVDIAASTFFMLSRWEETVVPERDEHDRFPAAASVAYKQGFLGRPVVDEYALILKEWLKRLSAQWKPESSAFSVKLSHDVDAVHPFPNLKRGLRILGGDLLRRRSLRQARHTGAELVRQIIAADRTAVFEGIRLLAELSKAAGLDTAFYFMAAEPSPFDRGYDPASPLVKHCIADLHQQGFEIGFHAGYHTLGNVERLAAEKARLDAVLGEMRYGGRQHYLRFQVPTTWRDWEQVGLTYDSTLTYADHEGFRCGTCHPFRPFDIELNRELNLSELPLIAMDATLRGYRGLTPERAEERILDLATRSRQVNGTFTLLWHNPAASQQQGPWVEMYRRILRALGQMEKDLQMRNPTS